MTIGQKFRPKMISAPKQPHASTISLWCQWPLRKKKKRERKYIHTSFVWVDWLRAISWRGRWCVIAECHRVCVCARARVIIPVCGLQNFSWHCLTETALFLITDGDIIAQRYLYFPWTNRYVRQIHVYLYTTFATRSFQHKLLISKF